MKVSRFNATSIDGYVKEWHSVTEFGDVEMLAISLHSVAAYRMGDDGDAIKLWECASEEELLTMISTSDFSTIMELIVDFCVEHKTHTLFNLPADSLVFFRLRYIAGASVVHEHRDLAKFLLTVLVKGMNTVMIVDSAGGECFPSINLRPRLTQVVIEALKDELFADYF